MSITVLQVEGRSGSLCMSCAAMPKLLVLTASRFSRRLTGPPAKLVHGLDWMLGNRLHKVLGRSFLLLLSANKFCSCCTICCAHCRLLLRLWARGDVRELLICVSSYRAQVVQVAPHLRQRRALTLRQGAWSRWDRLGVLNESPRP